MHLESFWKESKKSNIMATKLIRASLPTTNTTNSFVKEPAYSSARTAISI